MADDDLNEDETERIATQNKQLEELKLRVDAELRVSRPDRYEPGHRFLDEVVARIADDVPAMVARRFLARDLVQQRESRATKRTNAFLRRIAGADGQYALPVDWAAFADEPVAFEVPLIEDGETVGYRRVRVCLRAVLPGDWINFAASGRPVAQHRFDAEMRVYDAAEWLAAEQGARTFAAWAEITCPKPNETAA